MVKGREEGVGTSAAGPEQMAHKLPFESQQEDFPDGPGATTPVPNSGGPGWISGQGTRPDMLQLTGVHVPQLKIAYATGKIKDPTCCIQDPQPMEAIHPTISLGFFYTIAL